MKHRSHAYTVLIGVICLAAWSPACTDGDAGDPDGGVAFDGGADARQDADIQADGDVPNVTPVYVTFYSHNEEGAYWEGLIDEPAAYAEYRADLVAKIELLYSHGVALNWESDHSVLRAMIANEIGDLLDQTGGKNVLRWMVEDRGMVVDPHGHMTQYNLADVAYLIEQLGVTPSGVVGGFKLIECGAAFGEYTITDWEAVISLEPDGYVHGWIYPDHRWQPRVLAQPAMVGHAMDDFSSGVWNPGAGADFYTHQVSGSITTVGQGYPHDVLNIGLVNSGGTEILYSDAGYIHELAAKIAAGEVPAGQIYTASVHLRDQASLVGVDSTYDGLLQTLEALAPLVQSGQVIYADYESVVQVWRDTYGGEASRLDIDQFSIYEDLLAGVDEYCWGGSPCGSEYCNEGQVCEPDLQQCVPDCRLPQNDCPPLLPVCDDFTGVCYE